ncbi:H-NS histone family protein [Burkholderia cepacia]|uniref:H-NS histone family protein n=1 Tax=Burkholderia cepacia TaxID=292 RepID=UPI002FE2B6EE
MATYKELKAQAEALAEKAEAARRAEMKSTIDDIRAKVAEYGVTETDIFGARRGKSSKQPKALTEAKYRDPKTGVTWSGRGRAPVWIKDAKNQNRFLIQG